MPNWPAFPVANLDGLGTWIAALLTLAVLSAGVAENRLARLAFALLIGVTAGYAIAVAWRAVLWPRVLLLWRNPVTQWPLLIWFLLGLLLLSRALESGSWPSRLPLAFLVAVGVALAVGGAVLGTALPQVAAAASGLDGGERSVWLAVANALVISVGTVGVLLRFAYAGRGGGGAAARAWSAVTRIWGGVGGVYLWVAFGALFAAAVISLLTLLAARVQFLLADWLHIIAP
ncbi:MAG: hypothetical protein ACUVX9_07185 [Anaerolineae bacterium]